MKTTKQEITITAGDFFCYSNGMAVNSCNVVEVREKAIKVDIATDSIWGNGKSVIVYTKTAWLPKSALTIDKNNMLTIKKWLINKGLNTFNIKKYFEENNTKVYC